MTGEIPPSPAYWSYSASAARFFAPGSLQWNGRDGGEILQNLPRRFHASIQVNRAQHSFERVDQQSRFVSPTALLLATPQPEVTPELQFLRYPDQVALTHQVRSQF